MKETELRIGNWVAINERQFQTNLDGIKTAHKLDPIPLTEEWLERFGFGKYDDIFEHEELMWSCEISGDDDSFNFKRLGLDIPCIGIFYVHQLQNLYFALTGEELQTDETDQKVK